MSFVPGQVERDLEWLELRRRLDRLEQRVSDLAVDVVATAEVVADVVPCCCEVALRCESSFWSESDGNRLFSVVRSIVDRRRSDGGMT